MKLTSIEAIFRALNDADAEISVTMHLNLNADAGTNFRSRFGFVTN